MKNKLSTVGARNGPAKKKNDTKWNWLEHTLK